MPFRIHGRGLGRPSRRAGPSSAGGRLSWPQRRTARQEATYVCASPGLGSAVADQLRLAGRGLSIVQAGSVSPLFSASSTQRPHERSSPENRPSLNSQELTSISRRQPTQVSVSICPTVRGGAKPRAGYGWWCVPLVEGDRRHGCARRTPDERPRLGDQGLRRLRAVAGAAVAI